MSGRRQAIRTKIIKSSTTKNRLTLAVPGTPPFFVAAGFFRGSVRDGAGIRADQRHVVG
jgi:hypothetical protein